MNELKVHIKTEDEPYLQTFILTNPELLVENEDDFMMNTVLIAFDTDTYHSETLLLGNPITHIDGDNITIIDYYYSLKDDRFNRVSSLAALIAGGVTVYVTGAY